MNVDVIARLPGSARVAGYFLLQRLIGSRVAGAWGDFQKWTRFSPEQLRHAVDERLRRTLDSATSDSEHYRTLGLKRTGTESVHSFLGRFPILNREQLREQFSRIVADRLRAEIRDPESQSSRRYDWLVVKTGGTTGTPTSVVHDAWFRDYGRATRLFSQKLCGFPLGRRYFRLWGSEQDLLQSSEKIDRRILRNLLGEVPLNAFRAKEAELAQHLRTLRSHKNIHHLMTYVDAAASLAAFIDDRKLQPPSFKTIMACAGTVTDASRVLLEKVFRAEVFDKYGSRECADIACECCAHAGLHIYSPNVFVEIVDRSGRACRSGETGQVLLTLLNNHSFPMIRYAIGDLAIAVDPSQPCSCGLAFPKLASIQGRTDDMLTTEDGTSLSSVFVRHFVGVSLNRQLIHEWQLEQDGPGNFVFRYVPAGAEGLSHNLDDLAKAFRRALGQSIRIRFEEVGVIPTSPTGKHRWIINRVGGGRLKPLP